MYYEEKLINGVMHYRTDPKSDFRPYTLEGLSARHADATERLKRARTALKLVDAWGGWSPDGPLPEGWPCKENGKPKSLEDIVDEALIFF